MLVANKDYLPQFKEAIEKIELEALAKSTVEINENVEV